MSDIEVIFMLLFLLSVTSISISRKLQKNNNGNYYITELLKQIVYNTAPVGGVGRVQLEEIETKYKDTLNRKYSNSFFSEIVQIFG
jgi:predicted transcriptional regulator